MRIVEDSISPGELKAMAEGVLDSMINIRPSQGNRSRGVDDPEIREKITQIVAELVK
jgi:hypothetical protein